MNNTSNSSSNDGYSSNGDSTWTTPDLDPLWALPDLNATLGAAYQPQLDVNVMPATANSSSTDGILYPSGSDTALYDPQTLAFLNDPQTLLGMQHRFDNNISGGTNDDGALPPQGNYDAITGAGQQLNRAQPTFGNDNGGGNLPLVNAGVQQASAVPYYNGSPMQFATGQEDWSALGLQATYNPFTE